MSYIAGMKLAQTDASPLFKAGAIGQDSNGHLFKYVQYKVGAGVIAAVIGNAVGYYAPGGVSTGTDTLVTSDVSDTAGLLAGALMGAPAADEWCWIRQKGKQTLTTALVSGASGQALTLSSTTDGTLKVVGAVTDGGGASCVLAASNIVLLDCK